MAQQWGWPGALIRSPGIVHNYMLLNDMKIKPTPRRPLLKRLKLLMMFFVREFREFLNLLLNMVLLTSTLPT